MKKILFLSSAFLMTMAGAHAADKIITNANTCTVDVLGVSDNNATANTIATWSLIDYECGAGQYLLNSDGVLECTECPVGSYCPGGTYTVESENNGANACPTDYTSDAGAVGENECYMGCELACTQQTCPEHSNNCTHGEFKTTGKQYVNATCNAYPSLCPISDVICDTGYTPTFTSAEELEAIESDSTSIYHLSCSLSGNDETNAELDDTWVDYMPINDCNLVSPGQYLHTIWEETHPHKYFGILYEFSANNYGPDTPGVVTKTFVDPDKNTEDTAYLLPNANFIAGGNGEHVWFRISELLVPSPETHLLMEAIMMASGFGNGLTEDMQKRLQKELPSELYNPISEIMYKTLSGQINFGEAMEYIYPYIMNTYQHIKTDLPWVLYFGDNDKNLFQFIRDYNYDGISLPHRFWNQIATNSGARYCYNNTININWNPDNGDEHIQNMCLYDGGVTLPSDPVKPGYTFTGWKLVE